MAKSSKKQTTATSRSQRKQSKSKNATKKQTETRTSRAGTKQSISIEMLRSSGGASLDALMKATGWQKHSVRGFLAGVVRKRLKLTLASTVIDGQRVYRVIGNDTQQTVETAAARTKS